IHALGRASASVREREVLLVVGRGRGYEGAARRHGVRLRATGAVPQILPLLHGADALLHPTFYDPCSLVTLEALAAGIPVLTSRRNGASELLSGAEGELIDDPSAPGEIALALDRLRDPQALAEKARAARATALAYPEAEALARLAAQVERTAQELASEGSPGPVPATAASR
ncbi:MAG: glycosyltransferase family 4 protein, partial [Planctomycetota bacterium]